MPRTGREMQVIPYFLPDREKDVDTTPQNAPRPHDRPYFLFVGRLEKIKGLDDVIPQFANYPDADLLIAGDGEYAAELRRQAQGIGNVKFLGRVAMDELPNFYQHAIALIVPSVCFETFGIILIESFRMGTPVIARNIGPFEEIVLNQQDWVMDSDKRVSKVLEEAAGDVGAPVKVTGFVRYALGEGIEKEESDFAAEVAAQVAG